jgi:hypothetical protein
MNEAGSARNLAAGNQVTHFQRIEIEASQRAVDAQIKESPFSQALLSIEQQRDCPNQLLIQRPPRTYLARKVQRSRFRAAGHSLMKSISFSLAGTV